MLGTPFLCSIRLILHGSSHAQMPSVEGFFIFSTMWSLYFCVANNHMYFLLTGWDVISFKTFTSVSTGFKYKLNRHVLFKVTNSSNTTFSAMLSMQLVQPGGETASEALRVPPQCLGGCWQEVQARLLLKSCQKSKRRWPK